MTESSAQRAEVIQLEGKYLLTDLGQQYCVQRQIPLRDIRIYTGHYGTGFIWSSFNSEFVQKLVSHALLRGIDLERLEFMSKRKELLKITKHIIYGILQKKFRPELKAIVKRSRIARSLLERSPGGAISPALINRFVKERGSELSALRHSLLFEPMRKIEGREDLNANEKSEKQEDMRRLVASIDGETWFLFALLHRSEDKLELMDIIHKRILSFVERMTIADYLSFILMEFVQYAEKAHLINLGERDQYIRTHPDELDQLMADARFRERLIRRAEQKKEFININYSFLGNPHDPGEKTSITISVRNSGLIGYKTRAEIVNKRAKHIKQTPLSLFLQESNVQGLSEGLAVFYVKYLEEACRKEGIEFESHILRDERKDETISQLILRI